MKGAGAAAALAACGLLLGASASLAERVRPVVDDAPVGMTRAQQEKLEQVAQASLFGQFRSSMADFLWLKVDKYLHNGIDLRGMTEEEKRKQSARQATARADSSEWKHGDETTVVPEKERDWRGALGDLEREVKPFQDMRGHDHRDPSETLPLFRLMTWSNPRFINGYVVGAAMMVRDKTKGDEAVAFLREGARHNPESIVLHEALGWLLTAKRRRFDEALPPLHRAIELGAARDPTTLTEDERESFETAFRWLVINREYAGDRRAAIQAAQLGLRYFPQNGTCRRFLQEGGHAAAPEAPDDGHETEREGHDHATARTP